MMNSTTAMIHDICYTDSRTIGLLLNFLKSPIVTLDEAYNILRSQIFMKISRVRARYILHVHYVWYTVYIYIYIYIYIGNYVQCLWMAVTWRCIIITHMAPKNMRVGNSMIINTLLVVFTPGPTRYPMIIAVYFQHIRKLCQY